MHFITVPFFLLFCIVATAQLSVPQENFMFSSGSIAAATIETEPAVKLTPKKWKMTGNRYVTGGLLFLAGASKGFNETLQFHPGFFFRKYPKASRQWFDPKISWQNKYKNGDRLQGPRFPLSTTLLVGFTDQYHLNTMINRVAWTSAIIIKLGEGKKPLKHYIFDAIYYSACHQAGFALMYYPFTPGKND